MAIVEKTLKQGEGRTLKFTVTDSDGNPVDITSAVLTYTIKRTKNSTTELVQKTDDDFNKLDSASGIAKVTLSETDTDLTQGIYYSELKVYFSANSVEKSDDILLIIEQAVY
jgi:hypothetical protein